MDQNKQCNHIKGGCCKSQKTPIDHRLLAGKLTVNNWLSDTPSIHSAPQLVEVRFKNTRKGYYSNPLNLPLVEGDIVAVEAALGHDIGVVSLAGELAREQLRVKRIDLDRNPLKKIYRKAKPNDIEKWQQAISQEHDTMIRSRKIASDLQLDMKIGDVEYQGDKTKAIFYYIAEERVDFRQLIKVLAETFRIRIEMKQIGARQEAGRIGGIGPCGRKLCCSTFISNFVSVSTSSARYQDISLNPQKLAGQCGKLKCCLNYELDAYIDAQKDFPSTSIDLNTGDGILYYQKSDIFGRVMTYCYDREGRGQFISIPVERVREIIALNKKGIIPEKANEQKDAKAVDIRYTDGVGEESLNRFDEKKGKRKRTKGKSRRKVGDKEEGTESSETQPTKHVERKKELRPKNDRPKRESGDGHHDGAKKPRKVIETSKNTPKGEAKKESPDGHEAKSAPNKGEQAKRRFNNRRPNKNKPVKKDIKSQE